MKKKTVCRILSAFLVFSFVITSGTFADYSIGNANVLSKGWNKEYGNYQSGDSAVWHTVYFGRYWQNDTNSDGTADEKDEMQTIQWRILRQNGDEKDPILLTTNTIGQHSITSSQTFYTDLT